MHNPSPLTRILFTALTALTLALLAPHARAQGTLFADAKDAKGATDDTTAPAIPAQDKPMADQNLQPDPIPTPDPLDNLDPDDTDNFDDFDGFDDTGEPNVFSAEQIADEIAEYTTIQDRPDRLLVQLSNRLLVVAQQVRTAPVVSAQVWIKTGSIYEQEHVGAGLSHFLEHLLAGGTTSTRTEDASNTILGSIGAQTNAATSLDTVRYYINTTSAHTADAVELLSDWMQHATIPEDQYQRERAVIQREFEMGQAEPNRILWKLTQRARYAIHPARQPTIGYLDDFLNISRDQIYDFYRRMYVPNNMVFVVVGDIDKKAVVDQIAQLWNRSNPRELPKLTLPVEPDIDNPTPIKARADIDKPRLRLAWPGTTLAGDGDYAMDLLAAILGQGESSRLVTAVRDQQRAVNTISAFNLSFAWGKGFFAVDADVVVPPLDPDNETAPELWRQLHIDNARQAIIEQIALIQKDGPTDQELARAKRKALAAIVLDEQSVQNIASRLARDLIGMKDPDYLHRYARAIQSVSSSQVRAAAKHFLTKGRMIDLTLQPIDKDETPTIVRRPNDSHDPSQYTHKPIDLDNSVIAAHLQALAASGPPRASQLIEVQPIRRYTLPNGLRLLVGRNTVVPAVAIQIYHLGGLLADPPGQEGIANATASMLRKGTADRDAQEIARIVDDLGAQLSTAGGNNSTYTQAVCLTEDWPKMLDLAADITLRPSFDPQQWQKLQPRILAAIQRQADSWSGELRLNFRQAYFGQHPWATSPLGRTESVASLTPVDLQKFHTNTLGADRTVIAVFGDADPDKVFSHVKRAFASIPQHAPAPFTPTEPNKQPGSTQWVTTNKPLAAVQIGYGPAPKRTNPDFAAVQVLSKTLSSFPAGWLEQALRGRGPGLVYAVGAGQSTGLVPGYFSILFNTQPDAIDEALSRVSQVVARVRDTPVDDATLARSKAKVLADEFLFKQSNSDRAADAAINELYNLPLDEPTRFVNFVEHLTADQLQRTAQKYLVNPVTIILNNQPQPTTTQPTPSQ